VANQPSTETGVLRGKVTGSWTKYGGGRNMLRKSKKLPQWYCQVCRAEIPKELPAFMFPLDMSDYIRICNTCQYEVVKGGKTITFKRLVIIRRTKT